MYVGTYILLIPDPETQTQNPFCYTFYGLCGNRVLCMVFISKIRHKAGLICENS